MATTTTHTVSSGEPQRLPAAWPAGFTVERSASRLATLSMLTLFLELILIRWTAANNVHLANIPNSVLLASVLDIGVGLLLALSSQNLFLLAPAALAILIAFPLILPVKLVTLRSPRVGKHAGRRRRWRTSRSAGRARLTRPRPRGAKSLRSRTHKEPGLARDQVGESYGLFIDVVDLPHSGSGMP